MPLEQKLPLFVNLLRKAKYEGNSEREGIERHDVKGRKLKMKHR